MKNQSIRERLLASTMIGGVALAALAAAPAHAQDAQPAASTVTEVVVTGSRIRQPNLTTTSPVSTISSADVKLQGATRVEDVVNALPQAFASQGSTISNGSSGTATVNLRGLGCARTLVLVDGKRLLPGDPGTPCPDINNIPSSLVDRVDVVSGGASAVYGSDAVGGVVNFIMKKNLEGIQIDVSHGFYEHDNSNDTIQSIIAARHATNPAQFNVPKDRFVGGYQTEVNITMGANSADGKGGVEAYMGYRHISSVTQDKYDYSACSLSIKTTMSCSGSGTTSPAQFLGASGTSGDYTLGAGGFRPYTSTDAFNFAPYNYFQRPDTRYTAGAFAHYEVNKHLEFYSQAQFMNDRTVAQIAPSGIFLQTMKINCDNPLLNGNQAALLCNPALDQDGDPSNGVQNAASLGNNALVAIGKRNMEGGGRQDDREHTSFRLVTGARGAIDDNWNYDIYGQYGQTDLSETYSHDFSLVRTQRALQVDNATGKCKSVIDGTDPNCVPYNIFTPGGVTQAALDYLQAPGFQRAVSTEQVVSASIDGKLGAYGVQSPWADEGVSVALGGEYRREAVQWKNDLEFQTGDLAGQGGPTNDLSGAFDVKELFGEARVPLVQHKQFFDDLSLDLGYRHSNYSSAGNTDTYKIEGNWSPVRDIRFRASLNRAVRAPNVNELFTVTSVQLDGAGDGCSGATPTYTAAQCANTGVSAAQYGTIIANPAGQYNGKVGGNVGLKPETSDTFSIGTVITPTFLPGFNASIDYFDIKVQDTISTIGYDVILDQCATTGNAALCGLIHRAAGTGSLWLSQSGYIDDRNLNTGSLQTKGFDFQANYRFNLDTIGVKDMGHVDFAMVGTLLTNYHVEPLPGTSDGNYSCEGLYGPVCGAPRPEWRHRLRATWTTPWKWQASATWRYIGSVKTDTPHAGYLDNTLPSMNYLDLAASWRVRDNVTLRAGVNNVFDKNPPQIGSGHIAGAQLNGNTAPQVYDALGRYLFMGLTANF